MRKHDRRRELLLLLVSVASVLRSREAHAFVAPSTTILPPRTLRIHSATTNQQQEHEESAEDEVDDSPRARIRRRVTKVIRSLSMASAVRTVLSDATSQAVDMAVEDLYSRRSKRESDVTTRTTTTQAKRPARSGDNDENEPEFLELLDESFDQLESQLNELEVSVQKARDSLEEAREKARQTMKAVHTASLEQAIEGAVMAVEKAETEAGAQALLDMYVAGEDDNVKLDFDDVDYGTSEMAPPFLDEDQCLVPGEPVVRVEKAPENSRRLFCGIDILGSVEDIWNLLTDYDHLQEVVPNLVVNEVLEEYPAALNPVAVDKALSECDQCKQMAEQMKGSLLRQVGGAKIAGIQFSARTTLEVREWPQGLPDFAHFRDEVWEGQSRQERATAYTQIPLERYRFPRPFAVSKLPTRDISMQSIPNDDGEFRMYQGVWRLQPLPGCAPEGRQAMRLTYAVEVSPRAYLPVRLVEGRIVRDLCNNLIAIRDYVGAKNRLE